MTKKRTILLYSSSRAVEADIASLEGNLQCGNFGLCIRLQTWYCRYLLYIQTSKGDKQGSLSRNE